MAIAVGSKAPDFTLKSKQASGLVDVKLSNNFGKKNTVLLFFPAAFTSVCTQEMCDITAGLNGYSGLNADVIAISCSPGPGTPLRAPRSSLIKTAWCNTANARPRQRTCLTSTRSMKPWRS